jgi:hypothetical protein
MVVRLEVGFAGLYVHGLQNPADHRVPLQNAAISVEGEAFGLGIEHNPPTRMLLILDILRHNSRPLEVRPVVYVTRRMRQTLTVVLGVAQRARVAEQSIAGHPENANPAFHYAHPPERMGQNPLPLLFFSIFISSACSLTCRGVQIIPAQIALELWAPLVLEGQQP